MHASAERIAAKPPEWKKDRIDSYYWYLGTLALYQMGGKPWQAWQPGLHELTKAQRTDGNHAGSWDAVGVWDESGGRVYATAFNTLALEATHRVAKLVK